MSANFLNIRTANVRWLLLFSYLTGLLIDTMVLINPSLVFIPPMTLLILLFWSSVLLDKTHFLAAVLLGVFADALYQTTLGAHALLFSVILFMMLRSRLQFRTYPAWQQAFIISFYLLVYQFLQMIMFSPVLDQGAFVPFWSMPAVAILIWPALSGLLNKLIEIPSN